MTDHADRILKAAKRDLRTDRFMALESIVEEADATRGGMDLYTAIGILIGDRRERGIIDGDGDRILRAFIDRGSWRLHPDIARDLDDTGRPVRHVIDPSPGLWGGDPIDGLVTVVYACTEGGHPGSDEHVHELGEHTHHALYGPKDEKDPANGMTIYAD